MLDDFELKEIYDATGFSAFESGFASKSQFTFFGTSDKFATFKTMVENKIPNGTIAYLMDTSESHLYSRFKNTWY